MRARWLIVACGLLTLLTVGGIAALQNGMVPPTWSPLPRLDLAERPQFLIDWRLAELRRSPELCRSVLRTPHIEAAANPDRAIENGCGWSNTVRVTQVDRARLSLDKLSCELAAAFTLWFTHDVQLLAVETFGERIASVQHLGSYSCRNIAGSAGLASIRSEHATANAMDIAGFTLVSGKRIVVKDHWSRPGSESKFLREAFRRSCQYFRVSLGPDHNAAHRDHFHFDRGLISLCQ